MKKHAVYYILILLLTLSACKMDNGTDPVKSGKELIPLKIGNSWTYTETNKRFNDSNTYTNKYIISSVTEVDGQSYFLVVREFNNASFDSVKIKNLPNGSEIVLNPALYKLLLPYPVNSGYVYKFNDWQKISVDSTNAKVTVKAGTFECIKFVFEQTMPDNSFNCSIYVNPGVGIVMVEINYWGLPGLLWHSVSELAAYKLK